MCMIMIHACAKHDSTMDNIDCVTYIIYDSTRQMVAENMPVQYVYDNNL